MTGRRHSKKIGSRHSSVCFSGTDTRKKKRVVAYHPDDSWWTPPLRAWMPRNNMSIVYIYTCVVILLTVLAQFTPFCGTPPASSVQQFCSDDWLFNTDHILKFISAGLFILLSFRGSNAYAKFWEGRCAWGSMWKVSRDTAHLMCCHIHIETVEDEEELRRMISFVAAVSITTKNLLRDETDIRQDLVTLLSIKDLTLLESARHRPNYCIDMLGHYLAKQTSMGKLSDHQLAVINMNGITQFAAAVGAMERIRNSFIPAIYTLHQRFIMIVWLILLALYFVNKYWWYTIPLASIMAYIVVGIDSMACEIEEPFGYDQNDLDLKKFCEGIVFDTQDIYSRRSRMTGSMVLESKKQETVMLYDTDTKPSCDLTTVEEYNSSSLDNVGS